MGIFFHHGLDDNFVRPTGCCSDPYMPQCCCGIAAETCVSVMEVASKWAMEVNGCELTENKDEKSDDDIKAEESYVNHDEEEEEESKSVVEDLKNSEEAPTFSISYKDTDKGIECLTATGSSCKANSTICVHEHSGHFNSPSFGESFPHAWEVIQFFAKDACEIHDGKWNFTSSSCFCPDDRRGKFCLDESATVDNDLVITPVSPEEAEEIYGIDSEAVSGDKKGPRFVVGYVLLALGIWAAVRLRKRRGKKKNDSYSMDVRDHEEATELVSPRGFHHTM